VEEKSTGASPTRLLSIGSVSNATWNIGEQVMGTNEMTAPEIDPSAEWKKLEAWLFEKQKNPL
jgi:hypothetical protein